MGAYLDYARRGKNAWWRYLLTIALALVIWVALDVGFALALVLSRLAPPEFANALTNPAHPVAFFIGNGLVFASIVVAFVIAMRFIQAKRFGDILGEWRWRRFGLGVAIWSACVVVASLTDFAMQPGGFRWTATAATGGLALSALFGLGAQTFAEEFIFRGYLTQGLMLATKRPLFAALASGLLFGALHIPNGWPQCVNAILFGVVASLIAIRTGGIAFTFGLHLVNNLFGAVVIVSASDVFKGSPGLITQSTPGLLWWDALLGVALLAVPAWIVLRRPGDPAKGSEIPASP